MFVIASATRKALRAQGQQRTKKWEKSRLWNTYMYSKGSRNGEQVSSSTGGNCTKGRSWKRSERGKSPLISTFREGGGGGWFGFTDTFFPLLFNCTNYIPCREAFSVSASPSHVYSWLQVPVQGAGGCSLRIAAPDDLTSGDFLVLVPLRRCYMVYTCSVLPEKLEQLTDICTFVTGPGKKNIENYARSGEGKENKRKEKKNRKERKRMKYSV